MGMLIDGIWTDDYKIHENGAFVRNSSELAQSFCLDPAATANNRPRYWLIASKSCPWSHGATIARVLLGLDDIIGLHYAHGPRVQGYAVNGGAPWDVPGASAQVVHLHQLYSLSDPHYTGRSTVPVLWDADKGRILGNDALRIIHALNEVAREGGYNLDLYPIDLRDEIDALITRIYTGLSNAVYRAGFAQSQGAYDEAVTEVFGTLDRLEQRLSDRRYLFGDRLTVTDLRLFATLVRFDPVYHVLHRCCRRRLTDYPALWAYARDIYALPGIAKTVDFDAIVAASYQNDTANNPHGIVPVLPAADWRAGGPQGAKGGNMG